jgi:hypothetical protein
MRLQIEGLRRLEIPKDMQRKHGFAPLGAADGPVKTAIVGENVARLYRYGSPSSSSSTSAGGSAAAIAATVASSEAEPARPAPLDQ